MVTGGSDGVTWFLDQETIILGFGILLFVFRAKQT